MYDIDALNKKRPVLRLRGRAQGVTIVDRSNPQGGYGGSDVTFILSDWTSLSAPSELPKNIPTNIYTGRHPPNFEGQQVEVVGSMDKDSMLDARTVYIPDLGYTITQQSNFVAYLVFGSIIAAILLGVGIFELYHHKHRRPEPRPMAFGHKLFFEQTRERIHALNTLYFCHGDHPTSQPVPPFTPWKVLKVSELNDWDPPYFDVQIYVPNPGSSTGVISAHLRLDEKYTTSPARLNPETEFDGVLSEVHAYVKIPSSVTSEEVVQIRREIPVIGMSRFGAECAIGHQIGADQHEAGDIVAATYRTFRVEYENGRVVKVTPQ